MKSKGKESMRYNKSCILVIAICLCLQGLLAGSSAQSSKTSPDEDEKLANAAADAFFEQYRKTLDVEHILSSAGSSATIGGLRKNHFFQDYGIDGKFVESLDDERLFSVYETVMNTYFTGALYNVFVADDRPDAELLPKEVITTLRKSRVGRPLLEWYRKDRSNMPATVRSDADLAEFLRLHRVVVTLLRKHIPSSPFMSPLYLKVYKVTRKSIQIADSEYGEDFGFKKGVPIYFVRRDFFNLFFVKENGQMRVLFLGSGD